MLDRLTALNHELNQYNSITQSPNSPITPQWSGNGNLSAFDGNIYFYDSKNRLEKVTISGGSVKFEYDPLGRRTKKEVLDGSSVVQETYEYHYDGAHAAVEYRPGKTWTVVYGAGIDEVVMRTDGTDKEFYYRDGLNSVTAVADGNGDLLEAYEYNVQGQIAIYDDQGNSLNVSGIGNDITYTGRRLDQQTGNYYYRARYYNPVLGRFISRDPLSAAEFKEGSNLYAYVGNNGANFIDPYGLQGSRKGWSKPGNTSLSPRAKAAWKGAAGVGVGALAAVGGVMGRNGAVAAAGVLTAAQGLAGLANAAFNPDAKPSDVPFVPLDLPTVVFIEPTPPPSPEPPTPPSPEPLVPEPEPETK